MLSNILLISILEIFDTSDLVNFIFVSKEIYFLISFILRKRLSEKTPKPYPYDLNFKDVVFLNLISGETLKNFQFSMQEEYLNVIKDVIIFGLVKLKLKVFIIKSLISSNKIHSFHISFQNTNTRIRTSSKHSPFIFYYFNKGRRLSSKKFYIDHEDSNKNINFVKQNIIYPFLFQFH